MNLNLNEVACFLPFNRSITEDLTGNIEVEIVGGVDGFDHWGNNHHLGIRKDRYLKDFKCLYLQNFNYKIGIYNCLKLKNSENWNFENQDFTIQCWYKPICFLQHQINSNEYWDAIFSSETDGYLAILGMYQKIGFMINHGSGWHTPYESSYDLCNNNWYHVAMCRKGTVVYGFLNGVKTLQTDVGTAVVNRPREPFYIGRWGSNILGGEFCMAEFMVDIGHCWYDDDFTPQSFLDNKLLNNISLSE